MQKFNKIFALEQLKKKKEQIEKNKTAFKNFQKNQLTKNQR